MIKKIMLMMAAALMCCIFQLNAQPTYTDIGFNDIADVFAEVKANEFVLIVLG